ILSSPKAENSLFSKRFSLLSARKSPCSAAKSNLPQPFEFARRSGTNIAVEDRIVKTALYFALLSENGPPADRFASACHLSHAVGLCGVLPPSPSDSPHQNVWALLLAGSRR